MLELVWGTQVSFQPPSHDCHGPSDCHTDESQRVGVGGGDKGCPLPSGKSLQWPAGFSVASPAIATSFLGPEPTPSAARSHLFSGPTYSFLSTFLPHIRPLLGLSAAQVSAVRGARLMPRPNPDQATSPSCHHPTAQDPFKLASLTCISDLL